ncbi:hypothetical protein L596_026496 [Steinernema carpocapsae]|uniref:C-type lectin domain-containing protein n=1 Tax=Steinernema carpocapsae TaxID=34508 RepID=A0A4U5M1K1_STECR|nr:hypothetical protein L596_026496 [Steinernema carpocapsae]
MAHVHCYCHNRGRLPKMTPRLLAGIAFLLCLQTQTASGYKSLKCQPEFVKDCSSFEQKLDYVEGELHDVRHIVKGLRRRIHHLEEELRYADEENEELNERLNNALDRKNDDEVELPPQEKLDKAEKQQKSVLDMIHEEEAEKEALQEEINKLTSMIREYSENVQDLRVYYKHKATIEKGGDRHRIENLKTENRKIAKRFENKELKWEEELQQEHEELHRVEVRLVKLYKKRTLLEASIRQLKQILGLIRAEEERKERLRQEEEARKREARMTCPSGYVQQSNKKCCPHGFVFRQSYGKCIGIFGIRDAAKSTRSPADMWSNCPASSKPLTIQNAPQNKDIYDIFREMRKPIAEDSGFVIGMYLPNGMEEKLENYRWADGDTSTYRLFEKQFGPSAKFMCAHQPITYKTNIDQWFNCADHVIASNYNRIACSAPASERIDPHEK